MNANRYEIQWGFKLWLNKVKASGEPFDFQEEIYEQAKVKSGRKYAKEHLTLAIGSKWVGKLVFSIII